MTSSRILQRDLSLGFPSQGNSSVENLREIDSLELGHHEGWGCLMTTWDDITLSFSPGSYLPESSQSMKHKTRARVLNRGPPTGLFFLEEVEVNLGSNSADYMYNEDKIRSHKYPVTVLGNGSKWEAETERNMRIWCPRKQLW